MVEANDSRCWGMQNWVAPLPQRDGTNLARPLVDILEHVTVNGLQVGEVEAARRPRHARAGRTDGG